MTMILDIYGPLVRGEVPASAAMIATGLLELGADLDKAGDDRWQVEVSMTHGFGRLTVADFRERISAQTRGQLEALAARVAMLEPIDLDAICREFTAFDSFLALVQARGSYRPSLATESGLSEAPLLRIRERRLLRALADAYDREMALLGQSKCAFRW